jgi:hypothetical protein
MDEVAGLDCGVEAGLPQLLPQQRESSAPVGCLIFHTPPPARRSPILVFVVGMVGMVLATVLTVMGTFYFLKNYVLLHDSRDPLIK